MIQQRSARETHLPILCFFVVWKVRASYLYAIDDAITSDALRARLVQALGRVVAPGAAVRHHAIAGKGLGE